MFGKRHSKPKNRIDTLIGAETRIEGNISFSGGLRVDGEISGNIVAVQQNIWNYKAKPRSQETCITKRWKSSWAQ